MSRRWRPPAIRSCAGETARKRIAFLRREGRALNHQKDLLHSKQSYLKRYIGFDKAPVAELEASALPIDDELSEIRSRLDAELASYSSDRESTSYFDVLRKLHDSIALKSRHLDSLRRDGAEITADHLRRVEEEIERRRKSRLAHAEITRQLLLERAAFAEERRRWTARATTNADKIRRLGEDIAAARVAAERDRRAEQKVVAEWEVLIAGLREKLARLGSREFDGSDGRVVRANQRLRTVWIDEGFVDGMRVGLRFSVIDGDPGGHMVRSTTPIAEVEIVRVIGAHMAEAKILSTELSHPIGVGDHIHSASWDPGRRLHFAIAGELDLDRDGASDPDEIRSIISIQNGVLDFELTPTGARVGEMTVETRYLVLGAPPRSADKRVDEKLLPAYSAVVRQARRLGVTIVSLDRFLKWME